MQVDNHEQTWHPRYYWNLVEWKRRQPPVDITGHTQGLPLC